MTHNFSFKLEGYQAITTLAESACPKPKVGHCFAEAMGPVMAQTSSNWKTSLTSTSKQDPIPPLLPVMPTSFNWMKLLFDSALFFRRTTWVMAPGVMMGVGKLNVFM
jgi:hypothetical protein